MKEQEWLASTDPVAMMRHGLGQEDGEHGNGHRLLWCTDRKLRLFAVACCRQVWEKLTDPRSRKAVEVAERYADGETTPDEVMIARAGAERVYYGDGGEGEASFESELAVRLLRPIRELTENSGLPRFFSVTTKLAATQAALLREIVGNPWRPTTLPKTKPACPYCGSRSWYLTGVEGMWCRDCEKRWVWPANPYSCPWLTWNDGAVPKLARVIYDERRWDLTPILADALEDANCGDKDILEHLRGPGPHVRGCWVLDLILGRD